MKRLNGWEPTTETVYEYDDDGRVVRTLSRVVEPEWDDDERAWALALLEYEGEACPGCGAQMSESTAADAEGKYTVPPPTRCHRCTALSVAQDAYHSNPNAKHTSALLWTAERR